MLNAEITPCMLSSPSLMQESCIPMTLELFNSAWASGCFYKAVGGLDLSSRLENSQPCRIVFFLNPTHGTGSKVSWRPCEILQNKTYQYWREHRTPLYMLCNDAAYVLWWYSNHSSACNQTLWINIGEILVESSCQCYSDLPWWSCFCEQMQAKTLA